MPKAHEFDSDYMAATAMLRQRGSGLAGTLIVIVSLLIAAGIGWSAWANVDEIVGAQGRIEPAGKAKLINHETGGKVATLHVADGATVNQGDPLITLSSELSDAQRQELHAQWQVRAFEVERLQAEAEQRDIDTVSSLAAQRPDLLQAQNSLMQARLDARQANATALRQTIENRRGDVNSITAEVARLENGIVLLEQRLAAVNELYARGLYPKLKRVALQKELSDTQGERSRNLAELAGARAALSEARAKLNSANKDWQRDVLADLGRSTSARDRLWEQLQTQATQREGLIIRAPIDGTIQELAVTGQGQAIAANAPLMKLVPLDPELVILANVANDDIAKIKPGMDASIKIRAYDFMRFGTMEGHVQQIATDSHIAPDGNSFDYRVQVSADLSSIKGDVDVMPGMIVNVELKVGTRTILSYLTDRIIEWRDLAFTDS